MGFELPKLADWEEKVFGLTNEETARQIALEVFCYQYFNNQIYGAFCKALKRNPDSVQTVEQIPFLPIRFFKTHSVKTGQFESQLVFKSSGTTAETSSRHFVKDSALYEKSFSRCFERFYGDAGGLCILGLLPSYLERGDSSLVYMVSKLIERSGHPQSGFYLYEHEKLAQTLAHLEASGQQTILFGVSYALLDFAERFSLPLKHTTVIETGGMKGRRKELTKDELYTELRQAFSTDTIHAEYGMTELLSQAYALNGLYQTPPWMQILLRDETDPLAYTNRTGAINVMDLANLYSCSFIATDDRGRLHADGRFEVLGRLDNSDIRGCSQLAF